MQKLKGDGAKIGAGILLKVMAGDTINVHAASWWKSNGAFGTSVSPLTDIVNAITNSLPGISGNKYIAGQLGGTVLNPSITNFLTTRDSTYNSSHVDAWLNIVVLDEQLNPVMTNDGNNSYYEQVGNPSTANVKQYNVSRPITKSGYVYVYVSDESPNVAAYWDDLQVTHVKGHLLQENSYYPFGLEMKAISSNAAMKMQTNYKYNAGTELNDNFDIDYYETFYRNYDPQIGRFTGIDLLAELTPDATPYQYADNDPNYWNDPTGLLLQSGPWYDKLGIPNSYNNGEGSGDEGGGGVSLAEWYYILDEYGDGGDEGYYGNFETGGGGGGVEDSYGNPHGGGGGNYSGGRNSQGYNSTNTNNGGNHFYSNSTTASNGYSSNSSPCPPGYSTTPRPGGDQTPYFFNTNDAAVYWSYKVVKNGLTSGIVEYSSEILSFKVKGTRLFYTTAPIRFPNGSGHTPKTESPFIGNSMFGSLPPGKTIAGHIHFHWPGSEELSRTTRDDNRTFSTADQDMMEEFPELYIYLLGAAGDLWIRYPANLPLVPGNYPTPDLNEGEEKILKPGFYDKSLQTPALCACYKQ